MKKRISILLAICLMMSSIHGIKNMYASTIVIENEATDTKQTKLELVSPSYVLIEGSTGEIICEKEKDEQLMLASVTKIMTLLLIFETIEEKKLSLDDMVTVSEHAASMGGSQVYLEPNETQTVNTMIKCISIASANDASVAMAEHIAGSEEAFVKLMNEKAAQLGMKNTHFLNCCGLDDNITEGHYSTAYDIALMSRELITKYPQISDYATVWMDTFTHVTRKGESEFGLTNTNKLVRTYNGITGLKTGSTSKAKFCLSATARRNGMDLIAVIMKAPTPKDRFSDAAKLLDYGFANCSLYQDDNKDLKIEEIPVKKGIANRIEGEVLTEFHYVCLNGVQPTDITKEVAMEEFVVAPIKKGDKIGEVNYSINGTKIGSVEITAKTEIKEAKYKDYLLKIIEQYFIAEEKER